MTHDIWFCGCGRIQPMTYENFDWMQGSPEKRRVIRVCQNCGATRVQWLTDNGEGSDINGADFFDQNIDTSETDMEYRFIFSLGVRVPMMCGLYADAYQANTYICWDYLKEIGTSYIPDALKIDPDCCKVNVERLIREVKDDDLLKSISGYASGIDWSNTKFQI